MYFLLLTLNLFMPAPAFYPELRDYCSTLESEFDLIPTERRAQLAEIGAYLAEKESSSWIVICTHNSRRSHMGQLWLRTAAEWYGIEGVRTFSGGTEASAFNPRAVAAMQRAGFRIQTEQSGEKNPVYQVRFGKRQEPMTLFSKKYDDPANPQSGFAALMVCSDADEACPIVPGAEARFSIPYEDPKMADNTPEETARYDERARQIAREMFFIAFSAQNKR